MYLKERQTDIFRQVLTTSHLNDLRDNAPPFIKDLAHQPEVLKAIQKDFDERGYALATAICCLPSSIAKELDIPYSLFFTNALNGNWGIYEKAFECEMLSGKEQSKLLTILILRRALCGVPASSKEQFDHYFDFCIKNKISTAPITSLPSHSDISSSRFAHPSPLLKWGISAILDENDKELYPSNLKKATAFLKRVEKRCGIDPTLKGFLEFVYQKASIPFPLEGSVLYPKQNVKDPIKITWMEDYDQYALSCKLVKATKKSSVAKLPLSKRKMYGFKDFGLMGKVFNKGWGVVSQII